MQVRCAACGWMFLQHCLPGVNHYVPRTAHTVLALCSHQLLLIRWSQARGRGAAGGRLRRARSSASAPSRTAGAARQRAQGGRAARSAAAPAIQGVGAGRGAATAAAAGATEAHRWAGDCVLLSSFPTVRDAAVLWVPHAFMHKLACPACLCCRRRAVDTLRESWEAIRNGTAQFPRAPPAAGAAAAVAVAPGGAASGRRRLVRAGELQAPAGRGPGTDLSADPARQRAVAALRAAQGAMAAAADAAGAAASPLVLDLTSPSPARDEEEHRAWQAMEAARRDGQRGQQAQHRAGSRWGVGCGSAAGMGAALWECCRGGGHTLCTPCSTGYCTVCVTAACLLPPARSCLIVLVGTCACAACTHTHNVSHCAAAGVWWSLMRTKI